MPKNLTDVSTFTDPIVVPVGTDPRTAASVELAAQGLANRTHSLNERRSLQAAYDRSVELGQQSPHIDIDGGFLRIGAPTPAIPMIVVDEPGDEVFFGADLDLDTGKTLTLPSASALLVTGAGSGGVPQALIQTSGVGGEVVLRSGAWTPVITGTGGNAVAGDFTAIEGRYTQIGKVVTYSMRMTVDSTGWGAEQVLINLPVTGTVTGEICAALSPAVATDWTLIRMVKSGSDQRLYLTVNVATTGRIVSAAGMYLLT